MPPKKKAKAKTKAQKDNVEVNEIEETERKLKAAKAFSYFKETQKEERDFNEFQQQREKLNYFWIVEKKKLEDKKAELRNKERELQDLEEKHQVEIKVYKQRVKHLLYENTNELTQKKIEVESRLKILQDDDRENEIESKGDRRVLKLQVKEMELSHDDLLKSLKEDHDKTISSLRHEFERKSSEVRRNYEKRTKVAREKLEDERKKETQQIEHSKNVHIEALMKAHMKAFADIKNYYNDITHNNLDLIKSLKDEVADMRKKEQQDEKQMETIAQENRRMSEPFKQARADVDDLKEELERYDKEKTDLRTAKARLLVVESHLRSLQWEHEVARQQYNDVLHQRDALRSKFASVAADVKQKAQFKSLLLEKKLESVTETLQARDAALDDALARANVDMSVLGVQATATHARTKNVVDKKANELADLRSELCRVANAHAALVEAVKSKMLDLGVPSDELGFVPMDPSAQLTKKLVFDKKSLLHSNRGQQRTNGLPPSSSSSPGGGTFSPPGTLTPGFPQTESIMT